MNDAFYNDISAALNANRTHIKAWLGQLQYIAYSEPSISQLVLYRDKENDSQQVPSELQKRAMGWFDGAEERLEASLRNARDALANEWEKRRDPYYVTPQATEDFAHSFETNITVIAQAVLDTEAQLRQGVLKQNQLAKGALVIVKNALRELVNVYDRHLHEMTMQESGSLLVLRAKIVSGGLRMH